MRVLDFFKRRRERESAIPSEELAAASAAQPDAAPEPVGEMLPGVGVPTINLSLGSGQPDVAQLIGMVGDALRTGQFQVTQSESHAIELDDTGVRDQILGALREAGIDPGASAGGDLHAADYAGLRENILRTLADAGVELPADGDEPGGDGSR